MNPQQEYLHKIIDELPETLHAEIIDGEILLNAATPLNQHAFLIDGLREALGRTAGLIALEVSTVVLPATGEEYIPDLAYYRREELEPSEWLNPATALVLAVEIISDKTPTGRAARRDRDDKARGYASSAVPLYLLIDPTLDAVTLHSDPRDGRYQLIVRGPYGTILQLPAPFDRSLDTGFLKAFARP